LAAATGQQLFAFGVSHSDNGRTNALASSHGARIQTFRSSSAVRITFILDINLNDGSGIELRQGSQRRRDFGARDLHDRQTPANGFCGCMNLPAPIYR
jgi:hypothetical protein